jgi:hypothetical protein
MSLRNFVCFFCFVFCVIYDVACRRSGGLEIILEENDFGLQFWNIITVLTRPVHVDEMLYLSMKGRKCKI